MVETFIDEEMRKLTVTVALVVMALISVALIAGLGAAQSQEEDGQTGAQTQIQFETQTGASQVQVAQHGSFAVSDFQAPSQSNSGTQITATATVRNTGDTQDTVTLQYRISNTIVATREVELNPRESRTVSLRGTVPSLSAGTHRHGIFVGDTDIGQTSEIVLGQQPARLAVTGIQPSSSQGTVGSRISVTATITNTGDVRGSRTIEYRMRNRVITSRGVTVEPGESVDMTLTGSVPALAAGRYQQGVYIGGSNNGLTETFRVTTSEHSFGVVGISAPTRATSGDTVSASATVRNTGLTEGTETIQYRIDGETVAERDVTLGTGGRTTVTLSGAVPDRESGTYQQGIFVGGTNVGSSSNIAVAPADSARFIVYDLNVPSQADDTGDTTTTVTATVENVGELAGSTEVQYRVNDSVVDSQEVELDAGESTVVEFDVTTPELAVGTYQQGVFVGDTDHGQSSSLLVTTQPPVTVTDLQASFSATVGSPVSVRATLRNSGDERVTRTAEYRIGDTVVVSEDVEIEAVSTRTVVLQGTVPSIEAGTYRQGVFVEDEGLSRSLRLDEQPDEEADDETEDDTDVDEDMETDDDDVDEEMPGFTAVAAVLALLSVAVAWRFRQES